MKIKGENEEQVALATQIRDANLELLSQLKAFIQEKAWEVTKDDGKSGKETKERYRANALRVVELIAGELKNNDAKFWIENGADRPFVDARLLAEARKAAKGEEKEQLELAIESYDTAMGYFFNAIRNFTYKTLVPKYEFKSNNA